MACQKLKAFNRDLDGRNRFRNYGESKSLKIDFFSKLMAFFLLDSFIKIIEFLMQKNETEDFLLEGPYTSRMFSVET